MHRLNGSCAYGFHLVFSLFWSFLYIFMNICKTMNRKLVLLWKSDIKILDSLLLYKSHLIICKYSFNTIKYIFLKFHCSTTCHRLVKICEKLQLNGISIQFSPNLFCKWKFTDLIRVFIVLLVLLVHTSDIYYP